MVREVVLDTETTGLDPHTGHKIVEIGCVELVNHIQTGETYHVYINPERDMPQEAFNVHGLSEEFLKKHPIFKDHADEFVDFLGESKLIIHNAKFDMKFINYELSAIGKSMINMNRCIDTLMIARRKFPGAQASLDALCKRFKIDNTMREKHGALLDSILLAEVYLELVGGRQPGLVLDSQKNASFSQNNKIKRKTRKAREFPLSEDEKQKHQSFIEGFKTKSLWIN